MTNKVISMKDKAYIKLVNSLPSRYNITISRQAPKITSYDLEWDESIMWEIDDEALHNPIGEALVFNHVLTVIHHLITEDPTLREQFKDYVASEVLGEIEHDSNFNS